MNGLKIITTFLLMMMITPVFVDSAIDLNLIILQGSSYDSSMALLLQSSIANLTNATLVTMHQPQPYALTGLACHAYFPNITFYSFQLVHVSRVNVEITSDDDTVTQIKLQYMLAERVSNFTTVYIESTEIHTSNNPNPWYTITFIEIPQYVSQYLLITCCILFLTLLLSCACLICSQLSTPTTTIEHAIVVVPVPPVVKILPTPPPRPTVKPAKTIKLPSGWP